MPRRENLGKKVRQRREVAGQKIGRIRGWKRSGGEEKISWSVETDGEKTREAEHGGKINSGSSQFRVTPQLIVQVRWSQVSSSNRRPLGSTAVTVQHRPPSLSTTSRFHTPKEKKEIIKGKRDTCDRSNQCWKLCASFLFFFLFFFTAILFLAQMLSSKFILSVCSGCF